MAQPPENWPTPTVDSATQRVKKYSQGGTPLTAAIAKAQNWPTPISRDWKGPGMKGQLPNVVNEERNWPTPTTAEAGKISNRANKGQIGLSNHPSIQGTCEREPLNKSRAGLPDLDRSSTIGKSQGQLNPGWVEHLMGLPPGWTQLSIEWIACDSLGTE